MTIFLLKCQHGDFRYWETVRASLACTRQEMPAEVSRKAGVCPLHVVAVEPMPNWETAAAYGQQWTSPDA